MAHPHLISFTPHHLIHRLTHRLVASQSLQIVSPVSCPHLRIIPSYIYLFRIRHHSTFLSIGCISATRLTSRTASTKESFNGKESLETLNTLVSPKRSRYSWADGTAAGSIQSGRAVPSMMTLTQPTVTVMALVTTTILLLHQMWTTMQMTMTMTRNPVEAGQEQHDLCLSYKIAEHIAHELSPILSCRNLRYRALFALPYFWTLAFIIIHPSFLCPRRGYLTLLLILPPAAFRTVSL